MEPRELKNISAADSARLLALEFLGEAAKTVKWLRKGGSPESLHDFRVALRRLETCLISFPGCFNGSVEPERKRLKKIIHSTSRVRDLEVNLLWLEKYKAGLHPGAYDILRKALRHREKSSLRKLRETALPVFGGFKRRLGRRLAEMRPPGKAAVKENESFFGFIVKLCLAYCGRLEKEMAGIASWRADRRIHRARITAKRLRYLAEPLSRTPYSGKTVNALKQLQDLLGEMHDLQLLEEELSGLSADPGYGRRVLRPGEFQPVVEAVRLRRRRLFPRLIKHWRGMELRKAFVKLQKRSEAG